MARDKDADRTGRAQEREARQAARKAARETEREARRHARQAERAANTAGALADFHALRSAAQQPPGDLALRPQAPPFTILLIGQGERLGLQALLFAASLRRNAPDWRGRLVVAEPEPVAAWAGHRTAMPAAIRDALAGLGAEIRPFAATRFGAAYPYGNKIEALAILPAGEPFLFFDSDTLVTGPLDRLGLDFGRPTASMRRGPTWPEPPLYGPGYAGIWRSLYDRFGLDFAGSLDLSQPDEHWTRYLYFNAGWFLGADPGEFGRRFADWAQAIRDDPGEALACQSLDPWLDQVALPLVIHSLGGGRPGPELDGLDGWASCHYRNLSLLYAREADQMVALVEDLARDPLIEPLLRRDEAAARLIYGGEGRAVIRPMFAHDDPLPPEQAMRHRLRQAGLWFR